MPDPLQGYKTVPPDREDNSHRPGGRWEGPQGQEAGSWRSNDQQAAQEAGAYQNSEPGEQQVYPRTCPQEDRRSGAEGSRRPGGPMARQPRRSGAMAPEDQQRGLQSLGKPGQYDAARPTPEEAHDQ
jgi:hypothetical protein